MEIRVPPPVVALSITPPTTGTISENAVHILYGNLEAQQLVYGCHSDKIPRVLASRGLEIQKNEHLQPSGKYNSKEEKKAEGKWRS